MFRPLPYVPYINENNACMRVVLVNVYSPADPSNSLSLYTDSYISLSALCMAAGYDIYIYIYLFIYIYIQ